MAQPEVSVESSLPNMRLLRTKLYIPRVHPDLMPRDRLMQRLDEGQQTRLTLLSASAGFGKTTLLADWIQRRRVQAAWVSLDAGDNEPRHFWAYVMASLNEAHSGLARQALDLVLAPQPPPIEAILTDLTNAIAALPQGSARLALILDDYHAIQSAAIHQALEFFLHNLPPQMRVFIASREDPPLPLALWRTRRELLELRAPDLRFTAEEAATFLNTCMRLGLAAEDVRALDARTEGWVAGLQLAALSMQGVQDVAGFIGAFTGSHRYVFDYLAQEVLQRQTAPVRDFLLPTSILERLSGPLCDALTGGTGGQRMLERLEQANLFLVPLDQERRWYRYHHLFAGFLRQQLVQAALWNVVELHRRASAWYEQEGLIEDAVQHALQAEDAQNAAQLIEQSAPEMFARSELITLCGWIQALPPEVVEARPKLSMIYAWALTATGHAAEGEHWLQVIERVVGASATAPGGKDAGALSPEVRAALVEANVVRGALAAGAGDFARVLELMQPVLPYLVDNARPYLFNTPLALRTAAVFTLAAAYEFGGDTVEASKALADAAASALEQRNLHIYPMAMSRLAQLQVVQGQLHQAEKTYRQALRTVEATAGSVSPLGGVAYTGLGNLLCEWNNLDAAVEYLNRGIALAKPWLSWEALVSGYLGLARLNRAQGDQQGVSAALDALYELGHQLQSPESNRMLQAACALLQLWCGDLDAAARWVQDCGIDPADEIPFHRESEAVILARVWMAQGRLAGAQQLLERLFAAAREGKRIGRAIEIQVLQALILFAQGQATSALQTLRQALVLAEPEGWVRIFVDEGAPMAELLAQVNILPDYVGQLLAAFARPQPKAPQMAALASERPRSPSESLTDRELEVLWLIAEGLSNREIGERLVVSLNTVKTHVKNLFGKLGVSNRTQAVARARELGLLQKS